MWKAKYQGYSTRNDRSIAITNTCQAKFSKPRRLAILSQKQGNWHTRPEWRGVP